MSQSAPSWSVGTRGTRNAEDVVAEVADRLARGLTPTPAWYGDADVHRLELERLFGRTWQLVGAGADVREAGQYFVADIDALRSFIVLRGRDGLLRAFANVCPHRANELVCGAGTLDRIRCGYHGWVYDQTGALVTVPSARDLAEFDLSEYTLFPASVEEFGPFVFLNPDPSAGSLLEALGDLPTVLGSYGFDMTAIASEGNCKRDAGILECNWKTAVENALECYHCPVAHASFRATVDLNAWHIETRDRCVVQGTTMRSELGVGADRPGAMDEIVAESAVNGGSDLAMFHWIFPNNSISFWPGPAQSFNYARWVPLGPDRCRWETIRWWPADTADEVRDAQWNFIGEVAEEDRLLVEGVARGMHSGAWQGGVFALSRQLEAQPFEEIKDERGPYTLARLALDALQTNVTRDERA